MLHHKTLGLAKMLHVDSIQTAVFAERARRHSRVVEHTCRHLHVLVVRAILEAKTNPV
jgi:hypothetical protein